MIKNTSGQRIGAQMLTASDGTPFTGSVTVYVTGDGGTQALGSVGSGVCTHHGNGYHSYAPSQAETNFDLVAFTFIGTGALAATVQVYTRTSPAVTAADHADAVLAAVVEGSVTVQQSLRLANSALGGKASGLATTTATFRDIGDTKDRIVATVDADGNRSVVTRDLT